MGLYSNSQQYIVWVKMIDFSKEKITFHEDTLYISYRKYLKT